MSEINEIMELKGSVRKQLFDENGVLKLDQTDRNLVVTVGKNYLAAWLSAPSQSGEFMSYMGLGTGSTAPVIGNTTLQSELVGGGYSRQVGTLTSSLNVWQNVDTFGPGNGTGALTEAGLFSAVTSGTMFARQVFSVINKGAGDTLVITWQVTLS